MKASMCGYVRLFHGFPSIEIKLLVLFPVNFLNIFSQQPIPFNYPLLFAQSQRVPHPPYLQVNQMYQTQLPPPLSQLTPCHNL